MAKKDKKVLNDVLEEENVLVDKVGVDEQNEGDGQIQEPRLIAHKITANKTLWQCSGCGHVYWYKVAKCTACGEVFG